MTTLEHDLVKFAARRQLVSLKRDFCRQPRHHGFVVAVGKTLVVIKQFHDFYCEGYSALRISDISSLQSRKQDAFWTEMFRSEGLMEGLEAPDNLVMDDIGSLLRSLSKLNRNVVIQCEHCRRDEHEYWAIGQIVSLDALSVTFLGFDVMGKWHKEPDQVFYSAITQIQFDTPYINVYSRHVRHLYWAGRAGPQP